MAASTVGGEVAMQCPRCGLDNPAGAPACRRCARPQRGTWQHAGYAPHQPPRAPADPAARGGPWRVLCALLLLLGALAAWTYAWWALTERREIFGRLGDDLAAVSRTEAERSDLVDDVLLWVAIGVTALAVVCWVLVKLTGRLLFGAVGFAALALITVGSGVAFGGAYLTSRVESVETADRAVLGYLVAGGGWALMGLGLASGMVSLVLARRRPVPGEVAQMGYAAWGRR
ncbi:MAG: hypothetical protein M3P83_00045 [Actinomycetota bacterium]|nr:hypothetical protein [Actinomycetota bacterium]